MDCINGQCQSETYHTSDSVMFAHNESTLQNILTLTIALLLYKHF